MENKLRICIDGSTLIFVDFVAPHSCIACFWIMDYGK